MHENQNEILLLKFDRDYTSQLNKNPRNCYMCLVSAVLCDSLVNVVKFQHQTSFFENLQKIYSCFIYLAVRKCFSNVSYPRIEELTRSLLNWRQIVDSENQTKFTTINEFEKKVDDLLNSLISYRFERIKPITNVILEESATWQNTNGPILWFVLHVIFSENDSENDTLPEIKTAKKALLYILPVFIGCIFCREHYEQMYTIYMTLLENYADDLEFLVIMLHDMITAKINNSPIAMKPITNLPVIYKNMYREIAKKIKN